MEKRGATTEKDVRSLLKQANDSEETLVINMSGICKYADGKPKPGIAVVATGPRAEQILKLLESLE